MSVTSGLYLAIEGLDGSGKSTLAAGLTQELGRVFKTSPLLVREPHLPETLLLFRRGLPPLAEFFLFNADRNVLFAQVVNPALREGRAVVSDRSYLSSLAYQAPFLEMEERVAEALCLGATGGRRPDFWFLLDLPAEEAWKRARSRPEGEEGFLRERLALARDRYLHLAEADKGRALVLDALRPPRELLKEAVRHLEDILAFR